jgi:Kef-type K+ transport system membrane component KefB
MGNRKHGLFYLATLAAAAIITGYSLLKGAALESPLVQQSKQNLSYAGTPDAGSLLHALKSPFAVLLMQMGVILTTCRLTGFLFRKLGQPAVIGEMAAGILLGASFLGYYFPGLSGFLFPPSSLNNLHLLSQLGLILFMFIVGLELEPGLLQGKKQAAVMISHAGIVAPFTLGVLLAYITYNKYAAVAVPFLSYALFIGISMSITAFPVLARIIRERGLSKTSLGTLAITCAAADDVTAWCLLAIAVALVKATSLFTALLSLGLCIVYLLLMFKVLKPWLQRRALAQQGTRTGNVVAVCLILLVCSSLLTELMGVHAIFGAFVAGVVMPAEARFRALFIERVESVALFLLLPLFFVATGLRTEIGLLQTRASWLLCLFVVLIAVVAKWGATMLAARISGQAWKESFQLGALMNTRGLTELVVLNIGYDLGILSAELFTILVIMALLTTIMTNPLLHLAEKIWVHKAQDVL